MPHRPPPGGEREVPPVDVRISVASRAWSANSVRAAAALVAAAVLLLPTTARAAQDRSAVSGAITTETAERSPVVRVNQVGYPASGAKVAYAMLPRPVAGVRFEVVSASGVAYRGVSHD